jgi:hypothetical protein
VLAQVRPCFLFRISTRHFLPGADILISATLFYLLTRFKSSFGHTQTLVRRMSLRTIESGCATSAFALASTIVYQLKPHTGPELVRF